MTQASTVRREWRDWSCDVSVVVSSETDADAAADVVRQVMNTVELACSRFRPDSELAILADRLAGGAPVSPTLAMLVDGALEVARLTDGDVDPTLGFILIDLGYSEDIAKLAPTQAGDRTIVKMEVSERRPGWTRVRLEGSELTVPADLMLDLGASGKALAVDLAVAEVAKQLGCAALVNIGGDLATAGPALADGWQIVVQDLPHDPRQQVTLAAGAAMATSSTQKRRWSKGGQAFHHLLDPHSGLPADPVWRSVTVAAKDCLRANAYSSAAIVRGFRAVDWLDALGISARFVDRQGRIVTTGSWPAVIDETAFAGTRHE